MTKRERYLTVLRKEKADRLSWVPNFDHWLSMNSQHHTVPDLYADMTRNDIVRTVGGTIWARCGLLRSQCENVTEVKEDSNDGSLRKITYKTPVGDVSTLHKRATDEYYMTEHRIKTVDDIRVVKFIVENTKLYLDDTDFKKSEQDVKDDGISLTGLPFCMPFIQFGKTDCGWEKGIYLYYDHTQIVEDLMETYEKAIAEGARLLAGSCAEVINLGDNMDELTVSPTLFDTYAVPFYKRISKILHEGGKIFQVHWCGRTKMLLEKAVGTGIDVIEAVSVYPLDRITIPEVLEKAQGITIQGGVPSVLMCPQNASREQFESYMKDLLSKVPHGERFVLGMSDNVPPDADFGRVKMISDMVNSL